MNCKQISEHIIGYIDLNLDNQTANEIEKHISECENCQKEYKEMKKLSKNIQQKKEVKPDESLRENFMQMLEDEKKLQLKESNTKVIQLRVPRKSFIWQIAAAVVLLLIGFLSGYQLNSSGSSEIILADQVTEMKNDVDEMKRMMVFNLLKNESASQRIKAVNYSEELTKPDNKIINALINTLNSDKSTNVRLAAIYSLSRFKTNKTVINAFVETLNNQNDPMIQIVIINLLVEIQEVKAVDEFKDLLKKEDLNKDVKKQAELGVKALS